MNMKKLYRLGRNYKGDQYYQSEHRQNTSCDINCIIHIEQCGQKHAKHEYDKAYLEHSG